MAITIIFEGKKFILHTIPSGIFSEKAKNVVGNGVIIDPFIMKKEMANLDANNIPFENRLYISRKAHMIIPSHRLLDAAYEKSKGKQKIGSTLKGIGPAYTDKVARLGIRAGDIKEDYFTDKYQKLRERHLRIVSSYGYSMDDFTLDKLPFEEYEKQWFEALKIFDRLQLANTEYMINQALDRRRESSCRRCTRIYARY